MGENNKLLQGFSIVLEVSSGDDFLQNQYKNIVKEYIEDSNLAIEKIIEDHLTEKPVFIICNLGQQEGKGIKDRDEYWVPFGIVKGSDGGYSVFIKNFSEDKLYKDKKHQLKSLIGAKLETPVNFIEYGGSKSPIVNDNIATALENIEVMVMGYLKDNQIPSVDKFSQLKFSNKAGITKYHKLLMEEGLKIGFSTKETLNKILLSLKKVLTQDKQYLLSEELLENLSKTLNNINFTAVNSVSASEKETIRFISTLYDRGQKLNEATKENLTKYFNNSNNNSKQKCIKDITRYDNLLQKDSRDEAIKNGLTNAITSSVELLANMHKLTPEVLTIDDLEKFIRLFSNIFSDTKRKELLEKNQELKSELEELNTKIQDLRNNPLQHSDEVIRGHLTKSQKVSNEIIKNQKQINYYPAIASIKKTVDLSTLIILLAKKIPVNYSYNKEIIDTVIEIGKTGTDKEVAIAVIQILNALPKDTVIENFPNDILLRIPQDNADIVIELGSSRKLGSANLANLLDFMHQVLIENKDSDIRKQALEILQSHSNELPKHIEKVVALENKCLQVEEILQDCLEQVNIKNKLTLNCFVRLIQDKDFAKPETGYIINEIVEQNIQELPSSFIGAFKSYIQSYDFSAQTTKDQIEGLITSSKALIIGKHITIHDIDTLVMKLITNPDFSQDIISIIYTVVQHVS